MCVCVCVCVYTLPCKKTTRPGVSTPLMDCK